MNERPSDKTINLDLSKLPSYQDLSPKLRALPLVRVGGNVYGVPFTWGPNPLLYDTTVFSAPPEGRAVLWDPKYRGKISVWDELSTVYSDKLWIITESDRTVTTLLLPEEY